MKIIINQVNVKLLLIKTSKKKSSVRKNFVLIVQRINIERGNARLCRPVESVTENAIHPSVIRNSLLLTTNENKASASM